MIRYQVDGTGIAEITWDAPHKPVNILSPEARQAFIDAADRAIADPDVKGVIITSAKDDFIVGADLRFLQQFRGAEPKQVVEKLSDFRDCLRRMEKSPKPFVAALTGSALGGGLELCLACNYRVMADRPDAKVGLPEAGLSLMPGAGGTQRLTRMIGAAKSLPLLLNGTRLSPVEAKTAGIVDEVVPIDLLLTAARQWLAERAVAEQPWDRPGYVLPGPPLGSPELHRLFMSTGAQIQAKTRDLDPAPRAILSAVFEGLRIPIDAALQVEFGYFVQVLRGDVAQNVVRSMFFGINDANRLAARPSGVPVREPHRVGIVGAGLMGAGLAEVAALAGLEIVLVDRSEELAAGARDRIARSFDKQVSRGSLQDEKAASALGRLTVTADYAKLANCEIVIEAVFEDRAVKAEAFAGVLRHASSDVLLASNTSKIPITGLAAGTPRPDRFIGLHFFSPVPRMPLVEVIRAHETSDETLAQALDLIRALRKTPIVVRDGPGFYTSRCVSSYLNEGIAMLAGGISPTLIENCGRAGGMPLGPISLADEIGLDLMLAVRQQERADGVAKRTGREFDVLTMLVEQHGRRGRKAKAGFWDYPDGEEKVLWAELGTLFPQSVQQPLGEEVRRRLLHVQALEAARCFDEGIIDSPRDADIGSILGWGFPKQTGGVISYIDTIGIDKFVEECDWLASKFGERYDVPPLLRSMAVNKGRFYDLADAA